MRKIYAALSLISGLLVLEFILSFLGLSPFNEGGGLFMYSDIWHFVLIASLLVFGFSTAKLIFKKAQPNVSKAKSIMRVVLMMLGIGLILGALPAGFMLEISAGGCC